MRVFTVLLLFYWIARKQATSEFQTLTLKMRLSAQPFLWKWVLFAWEWKIVSLSKAEPLFSFWYRGPGKVSLLHSRFSVVTQRSSPLTSGDDAKTAV